MANFNDFRVKHGLVVATTATIQSTSQSVSTNTGALQVAGGVGVGGGMFVGGTVTATTFVGNLTGNVTGNVTGNLTGTASLATTATNIAGGTAGSIPIQISPSVTVFVPLGTSGQVLTAGTNTATWTAVSGLSAGTATNANNVLTVQQLTNATYYPTFVDSNNATAAYEAMYTTSSFSINPSTGLSTLSFTSAGNTRELLRLANPGAGANTQAQLTFYTASTLYGSISSGYGASAPQMVFNLPSATTGNYIWQNNSVEQLRINSSGNVQIANSTEYVAKARLQLNYGDNSTGVNSFVQLALGWQGGGFNHLVQTYHNSTLDDGNAILFHLNTGASAALSNAVGVANTLTYYMGYQTHRWNTSGIERVRIDTLGKVGIGTNTPASLLHVAGDARITGITTVTNTTVASSTITGAFQVAGGAGIGGNLYIGGDSNIAGNEIVTGTLRVNSGNANTGTNTLNALYTAGGAWIDKTLVVGGDTTFRGNVTFQGTNTFVYSSATVYTDNIISLHAPAGSIPGSHTWTVDDGRDIGFLFHYYKGADLDAFLGFDNATQDLEWYSNGVESGGVFTGTTYGRFRTGSIRLLGGEANGSNTSTGDLTVLGGVGIGGGLFVGGTVTATNFVGSFSGTVTGAATQINTVAQTGNATYFPTFVDSNNASAAAETVFTTSSFVINPSTGNLGFGNATPLYKLHINNLVTVGTAASVLSTATPILYLDNGGNTNGSIVIKAHGAGNNTVHGAVKFASSPDASNYSWSGIAGIADTNSAASGLAFYTATGNSQATAAGVSTERVRLDVNGNLLVNLTTALTNGKLQIAGSIGLSGNTQIRQATNSDGNTLQVFATQFVAAATNGGSYGYSGNGLIASVSSAASQILLDVGGQTAGHRLRITNGGDGIQGRLAYSNYGVERFAVDSASGTTYVYTNTNATSTITGAFQVVGGAGIGGSLYVSGQVNITSGIASTNTGTGALVIQGGVGINGALNAITKSFNISHPTKPGMSLRYGSLEGPEFGVYVRGRLTNSNVIELPEYWSKLVNPDSITVNLTPVGSHQKLYVEEVVGAERIVIGNENLFGKTIDCFYTVYAERADIDPLVVEG